MKKSIAYLLILTLSLSVIFTACGKTEQTNSTDNSQTNTSDNSSTSNNDSNSDTKISDKKIEITYLMPDEGLAAQEDWLVFQEIEKKTNIKIKPQPIPVSNFDEKIGAVLASGELADLMALRGGNKYTKEFGPMGAFVNLSENLDQMPNLKKYLDKYENSYKSCAAADGNIYGAPRIYDFNWISEGFFIRKDLLEENNLEIPRTFDDLYDTLSVFKEKNPDYYPITNRYGSTYISNAFAENFGTNIRLYYNHDKDEFVFGPSEENFKACLEYLKKLSDNGLLDPEFATDSDEQFKEKLSSGKGIFSYNYISTSDDLTNQGKKVTNNPKFEFEVIPPFKVDGEQGKFPILDSTLSWYMRAVNNNSKHKDEVIKLLDWLYSEDGLETTLWGAEGVTYKNNEDGSKEFLPNIKTIKNPEGDVELGSFGLNNQNVWCVKTPEAYYSSLGPVENAGVKMINDNNYFLPAAPSLTFSKDDNEEISNILTPINTLVDETMIKIILGQLPIEEWDKTIGKIEKEMNLDKAVKIYNETYQKMYK